MTERQIIDEILRYIEDESYNYAVLIDGEWGSGKTYFAKNILSLEISNQEKSEERERAIKYVSLYGCKCVSDIQENIAWTFADAAQKTIMDKYQGNERVATVTENVVNTSRKIGNIILKKFIPQESIYEIANEWLDLGAYIFIFDDLERCDCPINEVFGFLNELVEHQNTKIIILANEKEITGVSNPSSIELQYQLSLSDEIDWPKEQSYFSNINGTTEKLSIAEMERRRKHLFPQKEANDEYRKVREKLIGETLRYNPDLESIILHMIENSKCLDKEILKNEMDYFCDTMKGYRHFNLRTFQFFLSKATYMLERLKEIDLKSEYANVIKKKIVEEIFISAVMYKSNYKPDQNSLGWWNYGKEKKSTVIKDYVENGQFVMGDYQKDILILQDELSATIQEDDPFNGIYGEYYYHAQVWCEKKLDELLVRLSSDLYPITMYPKIIIAIQRLVDIGFSEDYMKKAKESMLCNINSKKELIKDNLDWWNVEDGEFKNRIQIHVNDIKKAILNRSNEVSEENIQELLNDDDWVEKLNAFVNPDSSRFVQDIAVFSRAPIEQWIKVFEQSSSKEIYRFKHVLSDIYPSNLNIDRRAYELDKENIKGIYEKLNVDCEKDLVKKEAIKWLKCQFEEIIQRYE